MRADILTIFPGYFAPLSLSLVGRARATGTLDVRVHDLRDWTHDVHRTVDDTPYGGGPGMVMRPEPWGEALDTLLVGGAPADGGVGGGSAENGGGKHGVGVGAGGSGVIGGAAVGGGVPRLIVPSPAGARFDHGLAVELAAEPWLAFACGRYEGIDERVLDDAAARMPVTEVSLGDYVLFGGEVAVLVMLEAVTRLLPGVLGNADSLLEESHAAGLLEAPVYTKPAQWRGRDVPEVLRSGDHGRIARWRRDEALRRTARRRPDLLAGPARPNLDERDIAVLVEGGFPPPAGGMAK
ncbi:tRNA (guanosine(37)-N1)-methyltransferase TrmD [Pilimelia anulata]|uniref:tRNA (guanosine(37)-N1)-methyltransferase TrmD n=1 Tax=Pilimelia anulata TaxID=53371 RepID=UPI00166E47CF|nr:tRNA (guanosine(37)-N1)-methyltransferase TrmD [Pilimelia anulata]